MKYFILWAFCTLVTTLKSFGMKFLKWLVAVIVVLVLLFFFVVQPYMIKQTKKHSPERTAAYTEMGYDLTVSYSSPSKKGRKIFGGLVPYDIVWRTGANEPTVFTTKTDISMGGQTLPAGEYSLWTTPSVEQWTVYFNNEIPDWGVTFSGVARDAQYDVVTVQVPTQNTESPVENFSISFEQDATPELVLAWDQTKIAVPISKP